MSRDIEDRTHQATIMKPWNTTTWRVVCVCGFDGHFGSREIAQSAFDNHTAADAKPTVDTLPAPPTCSECGTVKLSSAMLHNGICAPCAQKPKTTEATDDLISQFRDPGFFPTHQQCVAVADNIERLRELLVQAADFSVDCAADNHDKCKSCGGCGCHV